MSCPTEEELAQALEGRLEPARRAELDRHVESCTDCHLLVAGLAKASPSSAPEDRDRAPPEPLGGGRFLRRGATVGRYVVVGLTGTGGMGVVYTAYDPDLDRKVALKLCKPDVANGATDQQRRLLREAQAMARLSHPNVVSVFDAGVWGDEVFFTSDLVSGLNLRDWLDQRPRHWRTVIEVFRAAGRGLAAAHAAGIVHRDFKPENVLVEKGGRVLVTDFGLALRDDGGREPDSPAGNGAPAGPFAGAATRTGALVGTPAYMSPEQLRGERAGFATDQYSFCLALYEALYGERPRRADTPSELRESNRPVKGAGSVRRARVPRWVQRALLRGLQESPEARFDSMAQLLHALSDRRRRTWVRVGALAGAAAAVVATLLIVSSTRVEGAPPCRGGGPLMEAVWNPEARGRLAQAFRRAAPALAKLSIPIVERVLDRYAGSWKRMHREACEATRIHGHQSADVLERRMHCLAMDRARMASLVDLFRKADAAVVRGSAKAVYRLPPVSRCSASVAGASRIPPPRNPVAKKRVKRAQLGLARARALADAGKYRGYLQRVRALEREVRRLDYLPLEASWYWSLGNAWQNLRKLKEAEAAYRRGLVAAFAGRDEHLAGRILAALAFTVGVFRGRKEEGKRLVRIAKVIAARFGDLPLRASLLYFEGIFHFQSGDAKQARERFAQALRLHERAYGRFHPQVSRLWTALGRAARSLGQLAEARKYFEKAVEIDIRARGPNHPDNATSLLALAPSYRDDFADHRALRALLTRALALQERGRGPNSPDVASTCTNLALVAIDLDDLDAAETHLARAFPILLKSVGPDHLMTAYARWAKGRLHAARGEYAEAIRQFRLVQARYEKLRKHRAQLALPLVEIALVKVEQGKAEEALPLARQALALSRKEFPSDHPAVSRDEFVLCWVLQALGKTTRARALCEKAVAAGEKKFGSQHPYVAHMRTGLGQTLLRAGASRDAARVLAQAVSALERHPGFPRIKAEARFGLAKALWAAGRQRPRALALAVSARDAFRQAPTQDRHHLHEVERWLEGKRR